MILLEIAIQGPRRASSVGLSPEREKSTKKRSKIIDKSSKQEFAIKLKLLKVFILFAVYYWCLTKPDTAYLQAPVYWIYMAILCALLALESCSIY